MFMFTDTAKVKLFTAENESNSKTVVSLDTTGFGHCHLEYSILFRMLMEMYLTK